MFGYAIDLTKIARNLRNVFAPHWRAWAGAFFVTLAAASIEYDEVVAPQVSRISQSWGDAAIGMKSRLASFTL